MKYIRTKDGRIIENYEWEDMVKYAESICQKIDDMILKQSDHIEELCDAWIIVLIGVNCNPFVRNIHENISHFINSSHVIFAGIWCKGNNNEPILKPAAKMNEKGKLELL